MTKYAQKQKSRIVAACQEYFRNITYPSLSDHLVFWPIIIAGVTGDLWSKHAVFKWLENVSGNEYSVIDSCFKMVMRVNSGAAFSIASGQRVPLLIVSILAMLVVTGIFIFGNMRHRVMQIALALFTAGIIGNLYDRAFNDGLVRDFLDFYIGDHHWPAFNVADSMLCIAVGLLVICNLKRPQEDKKSP